MLMKKIINRKTAALSAVLVMSLGIGTAAFAGEPVPGSGKDQAEPAAASMAAIVIEAQENEDGTTSYFIRDKDGTLQPFNVTFDTDAENVNFDSESGKTVYVTTVSSDAKGLAPAQIKNLTEDGTVSAAKLMISAKE